MLSRTLSVVAIFTGLVFLAIVAGVAALSKYAPHALVPAIALQFLVSFLLAHFAMEGYSDEWDRAGRPIPPGRASVVALRYMTLSLMLMVPLVLVALGIAPGWRDAGLTTTTKLTLDAVLLLVFTLLVLGAPPALLVVSVSAASWGDLFSAEHWRSRFSGRGGDFFLIYVVFVGALFCVLLAGLPIVSLAGINSVKAMTVTAGAVGLFATGFAISLLGRLCGSFAVVEPAVPAEKPPPVLHPALSRLARPDPGQPTAGAAADAVPPAAARKTVLLDAAAKVHALRAQHEGDAGALVAALHGLDEAYLPNPTIRQALVMALIAAGRLQEAVAAAREAIPLCIRSGNIGAAAVMYEALLPTGAPLGLTKEQTISIADTLKGMKHSAAAVDAYAVVLQQDATDVKAIKGTIAIAQELAQHQETAAEAVRICDALIRTCPASPLLDFIKAERAKAVRKSESTPR